MSFFCKFECFCSLSQSGESIQKSKDLLKSFTEVHKDQNKTYTDGHGKLVRRGEQIDKKGDLVVKRYYINNAIPYVFTFRSATNNSRSIPVEYKNRP